MDSVQPRIDPVSRYGAVNPTDGVQPAGRATVGNRNASQAADTTATPASTTTVTLSRRAQELSAQQTREESRENVQQASDAAQARQDADDAVAANAVAANAVASQGNASGANNADRASGSSPRDAQVRRAYQASEGAASVA
ncbi:hypothetical protein CLU88_0444 [Acidovorax sp. 56]|uniref:hypothetical protein n=1 Tax=Acidovorax sp. 56 TaxID=2035205 RepID=UPI000C505946|nr:hypothetical protein [Acidovorax sp. 56]PIF25624.1 hypothetical protein CLU88_0444 [Acidovorax sp. 56]